MYIEEQGFCTANIYGFYFKMLIHTLNINHIIDGNNAINTCQTQWDTNYCKAIWDIRVYHTCTVGYKVWATDEQLTYTHFSSMHSCPLIWLGP